MATIIQKATKGSRPALMELYDAHKKTAYYLSYALLQNNAASGITVHALKSATKSLLNGEIKTEEDYLLHVVKQVISECKQEVLKKDPKALRIPAKKDFRLLHIHESAIDPEAGPVDNYLNCLPVLHRFILVLRYVAKMSAGQIGVCISMEPGIIENAFTAEADNLSRIYRCVKTVGGRCAAPTTELITRSFADAISRTRLPDEIDEQMDDFIFEISEPIRKKTQVQQRNIAIAAGVFVVCVLALAAILSSSSTTYETTAETTAATEAVEEAENTVVTEEIEVTEQFDIKDADEEETTAPATEVAETDLISYTAQIEIEDYGTITVALDSSAAPITVENFVSLAQSGFYDGLTFHRIMEDFMMQGGDPNGDGTGGSDENIVGEFADNGYDNTLSHTRGAISMARSNDYDSASSQFFIVHEDSTFLDGQYAVFGYVTDGMDIVDAICESAEPTDDNGSIDPDAQPVIKSITVQEQE